MAKRELRFAVVIYGGASLAVYMHGVTKELLKLIRASKVLHEIGPDAAANMSYADGPDSRPHDTEAVYFELLKRINRRNKFRVVVDVIAGASAGAINGIMLAKAIVDDAVLDSHTDLWLGKADTEQLAAQKYSRWRKWYLFPFLKILEWWLPDGLTESVETRSKLHRLVRQSWFRPPFSGQRVCHYFLEALDTMARSRRPDSSLLPHDQRLDVYASITDLFGYGRDIELHNRLVARENEHGAFCRLSHVQTEAGREHSDFADDNTPALVWAARASSSYAGAFAPFQHQEMQEVLRQRKQAWPAEQRFLNLNLFGSDGTPATALFDPRTRYFVDGGIVNNKPFEAVLDALKHRSADRQVRRLIMYVEPDPRVEPADVGDRALSYLNTIRAAATTIPRNQPVLDDLRKFVAQDERVMLNRRIIDDNSPHINALVEELWPGTERPPASLEALGRARATFLVLAEQEMGLAYRAYIQRRLWRLTDALAQEWALLTPELDGAEQQKAMTQTLEHTWSDSAPAAGTAHAPNREQDLERHQSQEQFLSDFDVSFRIRRVLFVIRRLNQLDVHGELDALSQVALSEFKVAGYTLLEQLYVLRRARGIDSELAVILIEAARRVPLPTTQAVDLLRRLAVALDLRKVDAQFDAVFYNFCRALSSSTLRRRIASEYVGFPMYDALLMTPGSEEGGPDPLTPVRVERISPPDAKTLGDVFTGLKCRQIMGFLGFFNRGYREHDYLWGRLNAADRIVDFLVSEAGDDAGLDSVGSADKSVQEFRLDLFERILQRERSRLHECAETLAAVAESVRGKRAAPATRDPVKADSQS